MGSEVVQSAAKELLASVASDGEISGKMTKAQQLGLVIARMLDEKKYLYITELDALYAQAPGESMYRSLSMRDLTDHIKAVMASFGLFFSPKEFNDTIALMKIHVPSIKALNSDCLMISEHLFWDKTKGEVVDTPTAPVFYRLFDTSIETKDIVKIPPFTPEQEQVFWKRYKQVKRELSQGREAERYDFLKTWANGSHDVYMDLIRAHAYMFLKKKPLGAYILIGERRNGKSTALKWTHNIWGKNNTSEVQLTQLGDPHYTHTLRTTLMNAPDEEEDKAISAQAFFKTMADHGSLSLPVMRSNMPVTLNCDFMCFFPMNHTPEWKGTGAAACLSRSLIIPFNADLSQFDKKRGNFMKENFTSDVLCDYMGSVFAYAYYYHRHDFEFSQTMLTEQGVLEQDIDSCLTYYKHFMTYFDGYEKFKTVYNDYMLWCQAMDVKINSRKELRFVFRNIAKARTTYWEKGIRNARNVYRLPQPNKKPLMEGMTFPEIESLDVLHQKGYSVIDQLDFYYQQKGVK